MLFHLKLPSTCFSLRHSEIGSWDPMALKPSLKSICWVTTKGDPLWSTLMKQISKSKRCSLMTKLGFLSQGTWQFWGRPEEGCYTLPLPSLTKSLVWIIMLYLADNVNNFGKIMSINTRFCGDLRRGEKWSYK